MAAAGPLFFAGEHLHCNKNGYCGIGGTGVACPVGLTSGEA
ncbi:hypothetical protein ACQP2T_58625 [Nonomuraea sp. CA-143628]